MRIAFNAILSIFVARQLGAAGLGKYAVLAAYWNVFQVVATLGVPRLVIRAIAREPEASRFWFQRTLVNQLIGAGVGGFALLATANLLRHPPDTLLALAVVALALAPAAVVSALETVFQGRQEMHWIPLAQGVATALQLLLSVVLLLSGYGIVALAWTIVLGQVCLVLMEIWAARSLFLWQSFQVQLSPALRLFWDALDFFLNSLSVVLFSRLDVLILSQLAGEQATGLYNAAFLIIQMVNFLSSSYSNAAYPVLSHLFTAAWERFADLMYQSLRFGTAVNVLAAIWLAIGAQPIIGLLYHREEYLMSARLLQWCAPFVVIFLWNAILSSGLMAGNQQRSSVIVAGVKLLLGFGYYLTLTAWLGPVGTALATVLAGLTGTVLNQLFLTRTLGLVALPQAVWKPLAAGVVVVVLVGFLPAPWPLVLAGATALYGGLLLVMGAFRAADWQLLRQMAR
ncbi:MAG: hypothetical protein KatS3mg050_3808 [Litorilinea sp.]|nr:MAG: hypothetical protein KatS3mg050_3808 [Litorilinea sp.]